MFLRYSKKGQSHVIPVETRIINHHIYRHTYTPQYSCCEENEVCNIYDNKCGF